MTTDHSTDEDCPILAARAVIAEAEGTAGKLPEPKAQEATP